MAKIISIIVPVHNEEKNIPLINAEILHVFESLSLYDYEIIYVNDGSKDKSQEVIENLAQDDKKIKSIEFSRNFGKEAATSAGLQYATGNAAIAIDADLQHPPQLILEFIKHWEGGGRCGYRNKNKK